MTRPYAAGPNIVEIVLAKLNSPTAVAAARAMAQTVAQVGAAAGRGNVQVQAGRAQATGLPAGAYTW